MARQALDWSNEADGSRMSRPSTHPRGARSAPPLAAVLVVISLLGPSCARSVTLGYEEAVEVLVLDGVDRARADCIVSALDGELDLAKVTGLDVDLDDDELALLASTSSRCAPALATTGGVVAGPSSAGSALEAEPDGPVFDIDAEVQRLDEEGLDPTIVDCLVVRLRASPDPAGFFADAVRFSETVVDCRDEYR